MGRKKKTAEETETTVECLDCNKKYFDLRTASKDHTADTALTHRIGPVDRRVLVTGAKPVHEGELTGQEVVSMGTPITLSGQEDALATLIRKYPQLVNQNARELTRGLDLVEQADRNLALSKRTTAPVALKPIPTFKKAKTMTDKSLKESLPHSANCNRPDVHVVRSEDVILVDCLNCGCKIELFGE